MRIAMLSPIAWRTPPRHYGPWENVVSLLTEGLVEQGVDVTLFATGDSLTRGKLVSVCPRGYEEDPSLDPKVWECLHISQVFERGDEFDLIHNHFDFLPLTYSNMTATPLLTTIHGFSSPNILPVYRKYNKRTYYVSISNADRSPDLDYIATVHHGIDLKRFTFRDRPGDYLLFFGRIHPDKGTAEAVRIARQAGMRLVLAGIVQDEAYFRTEVAPHLDGNRVVYVGSAGPEKRDELLGRAYALLHPIRFNEPFGLSVVESMACGTPVIAFARGSMPEVIRHGHTGYLVDSVEEAVEKVREIPRLDRSVCRKWVEERFCVERMVRDYIRVYRRILAESGRTASSVSGAVLAKEPDHSVERLRIPPKGTALVENRKRERISYHAVRGEAEFHLNGERIRIREGESANLAPHAEVRIRNPGETPLVLIEIRSAPPEETPRADTMRRNAS